MIFKLFRRTPRDNTIACLYGTIVAQARLPAFYQYHADAFPGVTLSNKITAFVARNAGFPGLA